MMSSNMGKLIVIEGLEGAGKSTAIQTVIHLLSQHQIRTLTTREPGGTSIGEILRTIIKNPDYKDILDDKSELLLFYAARIQLVEQVIKPALQQGCWVIADRFELSTLAYQGGGRGLNSNLIQQLSSFCLDGFKPDLTLYLDIPPELGLERAKLRGQYDRIEQQSVDFFNRVYQSYMEHVKQDPRCVIIDASLPLPAVQHKIEHLILRYIEKA